MNESPETSDSTAVDHPQSTLRRVMVPLLCMLLGLLAALIAVEVAFRIGGRALLATPSWDDRPIYYLRPKHAFSPRDSGPSAGKKEAQTFRIAVVGDSISFGPHLQSDDTFSSRLERMLNIEPHQTTAQVINYGVPGYSTRNEIKVVKRALREEADLIILQITLNDPETRQLKLTHEQNLQRFTPYNPQGALKSLFRYWRSLAWAVQRVHNQRTERWYIQYFFDLFEQPETRDNFIESLRTISRLASERNIPIVAVVFPLFGKPIDKSYSFAPLHKMLGQWLTEFKMPHLDLTSAYAGIPIDRLEVLPGIDRHPNEIAHRIAAEALFQFLHERALLPVDFSVPRLYPCRTAPVEKAFDSPNHFPSRAHPMTRKRCILESAPH